MTGRRVGHIDTAINVLDIERDQSRSRYSGGGRKCAATEADRGKRTVEDIDGAGCAVGGVEHRVGLVDGEPGVGSARCGRLDSRGVVSRTIYVECIPCGN